MLARAVAGEAGVVCLGLFHFVQIFSYKIALLICLWFGI